MSLPGASLGCLRILVCFACVCMCAIFINIKEKFNLSIAIPVAQLLFLAAASLSFSFSCRLHRSMAKGGNKKSAAAKAKAAAKTLSSKTRNDTEQVTRVLRREFRGWGSQELATKGGSDNKTLLATIKQTIKNGREQALRIQPEFWAGLRLSFRSVRQSAEQRSLLVANRDEAIAPKLETAWKAMNQSQAVKNTGRPRDVLQAVHEHEPAGVCHLL